MVAVRAGRVDFDPKLSALLDLARDYTGNIGTVDDANWQAALDAGWTARPAHRAVGARDPQPVHELLQPLRADRPRPRGTTPVSPGPGPGHLSPARSGPPGRTALSQRSRSARSISDVASRSGAVK